MHTTIVMVRQMKQLEGMLKMQRCAIEHLSSISAQDSPSCGFGRKSDIKDQDASQCGAVVSSSGHELTKLSTMTDECLSSNSAQERPSCRM